MKARIEIGAPGFIGGSLGAKVLNCSRFGTPYDAWLAFMGKAPEPDEATKERFEMGHQLEDFIAKQIERLYGVKTRRCSYAYFDPEHPWLICHPDRIATDKNGNTFPIEIKSASSFSARNWGVEDTDEIPYDYLIQCYFYFHVGVPNPGWMWQVTFADNQIRRYIIKRDEAIEGAIFTPLIDIVENRWMNGYPPEPSNYDEATQIWHMPTAGAIEADGEIYEAVRRLYELRDEKKSIEEEEDRIKTRIVDFMQDREMLMHNGEELMTYKKITSQRFDSKSFRKDHPQLADAYTTTTSYMQLR